MQMDLAFFAVATVAVVFAGVSKGGFGSGASFAATPMLALILHPAVALSLLLPLLLLMDFAALPPYWRRWHWPSARAMLIGAVPGVGLGIVTWRVAHPDLFRLLIGIVALSFVAYQAVSARGWIRPPRQALGTTAGIAFGMAAGFTSFVSHAGGPLAAVYLLSRRLEKTQYQATTVLVFLVVNLMKLPSYAMLGTVTADTLRAGLILSPLAFIGVWLGVWLHRRMSGRVFFALTYVFLIGAGGKLIHDALT